MNPMSTPAIGEPLVEVLARCARLDTSLIRRAVVEGKVTVNDAVVTDPAARVHSEDPSFIGYGENLYPYYPNDAFSGADIVFELGPVRDENHEAALIDVGCGLDSLFSCTYSSIDGRGYYSLAMPKSEKFKDLIDFGAVAAMEIIKALSQKLGAQ